MENLIIINAIFIVICLVLLYICITITHYYLSFFSYLYDKFHYKSRILKYIVYFSVIWCPVFIWFMFYIARFHNAINGLLSDILDKEILICFIVL